jgi:hypothetical protein
MKFVAIETGQPCQVLKHLPLGISIKESRDRTFTFWAVATAGFLSMVPIPVDVDALARRRPY